MNDFYFKGNVSDSTIFWQKKIGTYYKQTHTNKQKQIDMIYNYFFVRPKIHLIHKKSSGLVLSALI